VAVFLTAPLEFPNAFPNQLISECLAGVLNSYPAQVCWLSRAVWPGAEGSAAFQRAELSGAFHFAAANAAVHGAEVSAPVSCAEVCGDR
jgi:hypothetical protein